MNKYYVVICSATGEHFECVSRDEPKARISLDGEAHEFPDHEDANIVAKLLEKLDGRVYQVESR